MIPSGALARQILGLFDALGSERLDLHAMFEMLGGHRPEQQGAILEEVDRMAAQGWLRPAAGGDFFVRTELGRLALADRKQVTLLTRKGCHLCEVARARLEPVLAELGAQLRLVDVDSDPVLRERYTEDVPVIFAGPVEVSRHRADLEGLRRAIRGPASGT